MTNVLIAFYSTYGHIHRMALAVAESLRMNRREDIFDF